MKNIIKRISICLVIIIALFNVGIIATMSNKTSDFYLNEIEALTDGESSGKYNKVEGDCTKEFTVDIDGNIHIFGKKRKVTSTNGIFKTTYYKVKIDCPIGTTHYTCTECNCANFWKGDCGEHD